MVHLLFIGQIVLQKILAQLRPETHDGQRFRFEILDPLGDFRRMFRREVCVVIAVPAVHGGGRGAETETAKTEAVCS